MMFGVISSTHELKIVSYCLEALRKFPIRKRAIVSQTGIPARTHCYLVLIELGNTCRGRNRSAKPGKLQNRVGYSPLPFG